MYFNNWSLFFRPKNDAANNIDSYLDKLNVSEEMQSIKEFDVNLGQIINIIVSFDMGYSRKWSFIR